MIQSLSPIELKGIGRRMSRPRSQEGELSEFVPKRGKLPRGRYWARWRLYIRRVDGVEEVKRPEKIIDRDVAERMGFVLDYNGPLTKTDAWKVLSKLIGESHAAPMAFTTRTTLGELAREYIDLSKPNWGGNTARSSENLIETHLIGGRLGARPVKELTDAELQRLINEYVEKGSSVSLLSKLTMYLRAILDMAVDRKLIDRNPARKLKAKSRKRPSSRSHTLEECDLLLARVSGRDHLAVRLLAQLGLRSEELFALRRDDVYDGKLVIDEAIVDGETKEPKTLASATAMYVPPDLAVELKHYLGAIDPSPRAWLFPSSRKEVPTRPANFLRRVLKPAAISAKISVTTGPKGEITTGLNFQSLRRTSSTLFGAKAKDPKSTQAHMRHSDPQVTLKHYQQEVPAEVRAAALALEADLLTQKRKRESAPGGTNARIV